MVRIDAANLGHQGLKVGRVLHAAAVVLSDDGTLAVDRQQAGHAAEFAPIILLSQPVQEIPLGVGYCVKLISVLLPICFKFVGGVGRYHQHPNSTTR